MITLENKTAIITGGAHGIGRSISELFAEAGASVWVTDIDETIGEEVVEEIRKKGGQAFFCRSDVSSQHEVSRAVQIALEQAGKLDVLCNNAAFLGKFHDVLQATDQEWDMSMRVTVMGTHFFTRAVLPSMLQQKKGSIINIVSIQAMVGCPTSVAYTTAKAALLGFTRSAAYDYGPHNIRVNAICPGAIQTRISPKPGEALYDYQVRNTMLQRVGYPREVAYAALFLASDAASYLTGVFLPVDGGWTAI